MKLCIILTTRGNYAKFKRFIELAEDEPEIDVDAELHKEITLLCPDFSPEGIAFGAGSALRGFVEKYRRSKPDLVMLVGDRWETHSAATAAYLCGIPIAHLEGGELSGTLDNHLRYSISELSTYHFPCTAGAAWRVIDRGYGNVYQVGATSIDVLANAELRPPTDIVGMLGKPFLLVVQHPDTSNCEEVIDELTELLEAIKILKIFTVWVGPNIDAGSDSIRNILRGFMGEVGAATVRYYDSLPVEQYGYLLKYAACIVGNSSSGIRESCIFGTPNVSVGKRQDNREHGGNSVFVEAGRNQIVGAVKAQIVLGHTKPIYTYGDGTASEKILEVIKGI